MPSVISCIQTSVNIIIYDVCYECELPILRNELHFRVQFIDLFSFTMNYEPWHYETIIETLSSLTVIVWV